MNKKIILTAILVLLTQYISSEDLYIASSRSKESSDTYILDGTGKRLFTFPEKARGVIVNRLGTSLLCFEDEQSCLLFTSTEALRISLPSNLGQLINALPNENGDLVFCTRTKKIRTIYFLKRGETEPRKIIDYASDFFAIEAFDNGHVIFSATPGPVLVDVNLDSGESERVAAKGHFFAYESGRVVVWNGKTFQNSGEGNVSPSSDGRYLRFENKKDIFPIYVSETSVVYGNAGFEAITVEGRTKFRISSHGEASFVGILDRDILGKVAGFTW